MGFLYKQFESAYIVSCMLQKLFAWIIMSDFEKTFSQVSALF